jgi:hypothetical protein
VSRLVLEERWRLPEDTSNGRRVSTGWTSVSLKSKGRFKRPKAKRTEKVQFGDFGLLVSCPLLVIRCQM